MYYKDRKMNITNKYDFEEGEHIITIAFKNDLESTDEMLKNCDNLKRVFFTKFKTKYIRNMSSMFL